MRFFAAAMGNEKPLKPAKMRTCCSKSSNFVVMRRLVRHEWINGSLGQSGGETCHLGHPLLANPAVR